MQITYLGHSAFSLKGKDGTVVTDPFNDNVGFKMPKVTADLVTVSHQHPDHTAIDRVTPSARRDKPFIIDAIGEYEIAGISVFGFSTFHDATQGSERGANIIYAIHLDGLVVVHLGDLGHTLDDALVEKIGGVDVLLCPVGGVYTIDPKTAVEVIQSIEPSYIIPMHYKTAAHDQKTFGDMAGLEEFFKAYGVTHEPVPSFTLTAGNVPEETELVVLANASTK